MTAPYKQQNGLLSVDSKNIFEILKKWLYAEQDIVFREIISNASDAIQKLVELGEILETEGEINVTVNTEQKQLIIQDNGVGMSFDEVDQYINQIAFSGATDFINQNNQAGENSMIGHFGVGFYSSFMLSDHITINTKSYQEDMDSVRWECTSDMNYRMYKSDKSSRGTDVIFDLKDDSPYLSNPEIVLDIIRKYFVFSKIKIHFKSTTIQKTIVNDPDPIWKKPEHNINPKDMNDFFKLFFQSTTDPLFWITFQSSDIGVKGILFFRNTKNGTEELEGTIKVYSRGVYIGDNIQEIIPKFVNLQSGIIECDNLPLVVSRSDIRDEKSKDDMLTLIHECLVQEVTIAMNEMFQNNRSIYEKHWSNLNAFIKYSILQDKTFASVMMRKVLFMDIHGHFQTIQDYADQVAAISHPNTIYYSSDAIDQAHYISIFKKCGLNALLFDHVIDQPYMHKYEVSKPGLKFIRIDSNIESLFEGYLHDDEKGKAKILNDKIESALGDRLDDMTLKVTNLKHNSISTLIINDEKSRRMTDMLEIYGMIDPTDVSSKKIQSKSSYLINMNNPIIQYILESSDDILSEIVINQLFDLSLMSQQALKAEDVEEFIARSESVINTLLKK